jgi:hypothetical protein
MLVKLNWWEFLIYFFPSSFFCWIQDPGSGMEQKISSSGINIPDPQHCWKLKSNNFHISGSPGTGAHFHIDNVHQSSWQAQASFF